MQVRHHRINPWSWNFWRIHLINLIVGLFVYVVIPMWPVLTAHTQGTPLKGLAWTMSLYVVGLYLPGPWMNYLLDRYYRKHIAAYAMLAAVAMTFVVSLQLPFWLLAVARLLQGVAFAMFQIALGSTILVDVSDSPNRTLTTHVYYWFSRLALPLGPTLGLVAWRWHDPGLFAGVALMLAVAAFVLMVRLQVPFRTPLQTKRMSRDRFWMHNAWPLFLPLVLLMLPVGIGMSSCRTLDFYAMMAAGVCVALVFHMLMFRGADMRAEVTMGCIFVVAAVLLQSTGDDMTVYRAAALLYGSGAGLASSRFQLFFNRISDHCERGTAQTTYFLAWETGITLGFLAGCLFSADYPRFTALVAMASVVMAMVAYLAKVNTWVVQNRAR